MAKYKKLKVPKQHFKVRVQRFPEFPYAAITWVDVKNPLGMWPIFCAKSTYEVLPLVAMFLGTVPEDPKVQEQVEDPDLRVKWFTIFTMDTSPLDAVASYAAMPRKVADDMWFNYFVP